MANLIVKDLIKNSRNEFAVKNNMSIFHLNNIIKRKVLQLKNGNFIVIRNDIITLKV